MNAARKVRLGGTDRTIGFEQTLARVKPLFARFGITRVADVTGLDRIGIPVWIACRPNSRSLSVSQGKGACPLAAQVSAVMECIELHHAERPGLPLLMGSTLELLDDGVAIVDVDRLAGVTASRYSPARPLLWAEATDIKTARGTWVPYEVVHTSALVPAPTGSGCFSSTSNGLASGNHIAEATVHALCEVIERDAAAVWQCLPYERREATRVDPATVEDAACAGVLDRFAAAGIAVTMHDITSDIAVPAFLCEIRDERGLRPLSHSGMGCHLDPAIALLRALTEAAQSRLTYITGSRDDIFRDEYRAARRAPPVAAPPPRMIALRAMAEDARRTLTFDDDVALLSARLAAAGLDTVLRVDLTRRDVGIPVVRVIVPGLEAPDDDPSYRPGGRARAARARHMTEVAA